MHRTIVVAALLCSAWSPLFAAESLRRMEWKIDGVTREALVYVPAAAAKTASPLVFAFHGHGGTMKHAAATFAYQKHWPEAIAVYMQGLNTPGQLTDPEGKKPGWQKAAGEQKDRDLKFFDAVLATMKKDFRVDEKRIYSTGHSNGGSFTYLLWAARGEVFAAVAPSGAVMRRPQDLKPKPVLHVAGEKDELVRFEWQKLMMDALRRLNGCGEGKPWDENKGCMLYPSKGGTPVITYVYPGGHTFPQEVPPIIVKFFKEHARAK
jgi:polyhydroxybutyrate depolymerase